MRLYFVRHGESEANILHEFSNRGLKHGLTQKGREQAQQLARSLQDVTISKLYSSPLLRARQTAEILGQAFGLSYTVTDALREFDCGVLEGKSDPAGWAMHHQVQVDWLEHQQWDKRIPEGESFLDMQARFVPFIRQLQQTHLGDETVLLVSHGGLLCCMLSLVFSNIDFDFVKTHHLSNTAYVIAEGSPAELTCLSWAGEDIIGQPQKGGATCY